jgi:uncharacterized protein YcbK (DUF882 family)
VGDLSEHFSRWEFACPDGCGFDTVDVEQIMILEAVWKHFGHRIHIISGCRCLTYNRSLVDKGGNRISKDTSQHVQGKASDFRVESVQAKFVYAFLTNRFPDRFGFGSYDRFTHADPRSIKARW